MPGHTEESTWETGDVVQVQPCLTTPARLKVTLSLWQRDDDEDAVACGIDAVDGNGQLVAMERWFAPRTLEWGEAMTLFRRRLSALFYDLNSPFN